MKYYLYNYIWMAVNGKKALLLQVYTVNPNKLAKKLGYMKIKAASEYA